MRRDIKGVDHHPGHSTPQGIKPCGFRIALQVIRVIHVICEICGLKELHFFFHRIQQGAFKEA